MKKIYNKEDFKEALQNKERNVLIENTNLGNLLILVYRIQNGLIPEVVIDRIEPNRPCKFAIGEGVVINVDDTLAKEAIALNQKFEDLSIELDVEEIVKPQINLYYGQ